MPHPVLFTNKLNKMLQVIGGFDWFTLCPHNDKQKLRGLTIYEQT